MDKTQTILVVDDQAENLATLGDLLEPYFRVKAATSGSRALKSAASAPKPDLILLDVMMPDMDGYAVLARLRESPQTRDIPVIFVTAMDAAADEERGLELGAVDYIAKPIKPLVVLARVRTQLENKRARDWLKDQNAYLEAEVLRRTHDGEIIQNASLAALAILAETRDTDTGAHIYRTQGYVEAIAVSLSSHPDYTEGLSPEQIALMVKAAPLHDIGKVGIPDHILLKPGKFTDEEFRLMQSHARIGGEAIAKAMQRVRDADHSAFRADERPLAFLKVARQIATWHHERWDGRGYPDQLKEREIPLSARIMAVADVFDALISARVYKPPMAIPEAFELIRSEQGKHFDPHVVDAFFDVRDQVVRIAQRYSNP